MTLQKKGNKGQNNNLIYSLIRLDHSKSGHVYKLIGDEATGRNAFPNQKLILELMLPRFCEKNLHLAVDSKVEIHNE